MDRPFRRRRGNGKEMSAPATAAHFGATQQDGRVGGGRPDHALVLGRADTCSLADL